MRELYSLLDEIFPILREHKDRIILGVETAASIQGLSPTIGVPVTFLVEEELNLGVDPALVEFVKVEKLDFTDTSDFDGIRITEPERTLSDMIKLDCDPQTINESVAYFYSIHGNDWTRLNALGEREGILEELQSYYEDAIDHIRH